MPSKKPEGHIPRPPNKFIIYRKDKVKELQAEDDRRDVQSNYSKKIAQMWAAEPAEVREMYAALAKEAKNDHKVMYPDYMFMPVKKRGAPEGTRPESPMSLPSLASSSGSSTTQTSPGLCTPSSASSQLSGPSYSPQALAQGMSNGRLVEQYNYMATISQYQRAAQLHAYQQTMLHDRAHARQHTAGFTTGPGSMRQVQRRPRATADRALPYLRANAPNAAQYQHPGRRQVAEPPLGHPQRRARLRNEPPVYDMQRRMGVPPLSQTVQGQPPRWNFKSAPLDVGFYPFAAAPPQASVAHLDSQMPQMQPQAPPPGQYSIHPFTFPARSGSSRMQAQPPPPSSSASARPQAPAMDAFPEWNLNMVPVASSGMSAQPSSLNGATSFEGMYGAAPSSTTINSNFDLRGTMSMGSFSSDAMVGTANTPFLFDLVAPAFEAATFPFTWNDVPEQALTPQVAIDACYASFGGQPAGTGEHQAPRGMTQQPSVVDVSPPSGSHNPQETLPEDAVWPSGMLFDSSDAELEAWFALRPETE